jgi:dienelactone hydrolase
LFAVSLAICLPFAAQSPEQRRSQIRAQMERVMGPFPKRAKVPLDLKVIEAVREDAYERRKITFAVEKGDRVPAWLLIPHRREPKAAAVVCLHQTVKTGKDEVVGINARPNRELAKELAMRGFVVLAPDYPNFGEYQVDVYAMGYASATMKGIWNHMRAVDLLQSLPQVDSTRIGAAGHSLGGHNSLFLAAFDDRIRAVVTSCGFTSFRKYMKGDLTGWSHKGYMPRIAEVFGKDPTRMPFDFADIFELIAPRAVFINAPIHDSNFDLSGVQDTLRAATPFYSRRQGANRLVAEHPDCAHDFPPDVRDRAYAFLERWLAGRR